MNNYINEYMNKFILDTRLKCMDKCQYSINRDEAYRKCVTSEPYDLFSLSIIYNRGSGNRTATPNFFNDDPHDYNYYLKINKEAKYGDMPSRW